MIEQDKTYKQVADAVGVPVQRLWEWIRANPERSRRAERAREASARAADDAALHIILSLPSDATIGDIARAREAANHLRWRAKCRAPRDYGDRQQVDMSVSVDHLTADQRAAQAAAILVEARRQMDTQMIDITPETDE